MQYLTILALSLGILSGASAFCDNRRSSSGGIRCEWFGDGPRCGTGDFEIGDFDYYDRELVAWTRNSNARQEYEDGNISRDCYEDYGPRCFTGFKRLWCD
ncbi:hypothetical protein EDB80DRAFT_714792 [Ilyonectria destructans]|nr:hypothetical protein EDB80DRAFT_714792 [Ilyonectria destructans]